MFLFKVLEDASYVSLPPLGVQSVVDLRHGCGENFLPKQRWQLDLVFEKRWVCAPWLCE
jgi:hypothetical protein